MTVRITDRTPLILSLPLGTPLLGEDGRLRTKLVSGGKAVYSPYGAGARRAVVVSIGGVGQLVFVDWPGSLPPARPYCPPAVAEPAPSPAPTVLIIPTSPEHIAAQQPTLGYAPYGFIIYGHAAEWIDGGNGYPARIAYPETFAGMASVEGQTFPVFVLVHGGPLSIGQLGGMDTLAGWLATQGAVAIAVDYPTRPEDGGAWRESADLIMRSIRHARRIAPTYRGRSDRVTLVAHSFGGLIGSLVALGAFVSADGPDTYVSLDAISTVPPFAQGFESAPDPRSLIGARKLPVTVIADASLPVSAEESASFVAALHAAGYPGRYLIIDGATHDSLLSDVGVIKAIMEA